MSQSIGLSSSLPTKVPPGGGNPTQAQAAESFVQRGAWVPQLVLAEAAWVLASIYQKKPPEIAKAIEMLLKDAEGSDIESEPCGKPSKPIQSGQRLFRRSYFSQQYGQSSRMILFPNFLPSMDWC